MRLCSVRNRRLLIFQSGEAFAHFLRSEAKAFIIYQHQLTGAGLVGQGCCDLFYFIKDVLIISSYKEYHLWVENGSLGKLNFFN